jgi:hypothetical protein
MEEQTKKTGETVIPSGLLMLQEHVRYALYTRRVKSYKYHQDIMESVKVWFQNIEAQGGKTMFRADVNLSRLAFAWCTAFQLKVRYPCAITSLPFLYSVLYL